MSIPVEPEAVESVFATLYATIVARREAILGSATSTVKNPLNDANDTENSRADKPSYTQELLRKGVSAINAKILEEAEETVEAGETLATLRQASPPPQKIQLDPKRAHVVHEIADLLYHTFVLAGYLDISLRDIQQELYNRSQGKKDQKTV